MKKKVRMTELERHIRDLIEKLDEKRYLEEVLPLRIRTEKNKSAKGKKLYLLKTEPLIQYFIEKLDLFNDPEIKSMKNVKDKKRSIIYYLRKIIDEQRIQRSSHDYHKQLQPLLKKSKFRIDIGAIVFTVKPKFHQSFMKMAYSYLHNDAGFQPFVVGGSDLWKSDNKFFTFILGEGPAYINFVTILLNEIKENGGDYRLRGLSKEKIAQIKQVFSSLDPKKVFEEDLIEIDIASPEAVENTPFFLAYITSTLAKKGINFVESTSCFNTTILITSLENRTVIEQTLRRMGVRG